ARTRACRGRRRPPRRSRAGTRRRGTPCRDRRDCPCAAGAVPTRSRRPQRFGKVPSWDSPVTPYVELHCHSAYSFLDGASRPEELAATAAELGYEALALTDHDGVSGSLEFAHAAKLFGIRAITRAQLTLEGGAHLTPPPHTPRRPPPPPPAPRAPRRPPPRPPHARLLARVPRPDPALAPPRAPARAHRGAHLSPRLRPPRARRPQPQRRRPHRPGVRRRRLLR